MIFNSAKLLKLKKSFNYFILLTILIGILTSCSIHKRRYSNGFYVNTSKISRPNSISNFKHKNNLATNLCLRQTTSDNFQTEKSEEEVFLKIPQTSYKSKIQLSNIERKIENKFLDTIHKSKEPIISMQVKEPKKRMEIFTLLSLCIYFLTIATIFLVIISIYIFSVTEIIILLSLISLIYPLAQFLLALVGSIIVKKHPNKYKDSKLAEFLMVYSLFTLLLSIIWYILANIQFGNFEL